MTDCFSAGTLEQRQQEKKKRKNVPIKPPKDTEYKQK